MWEIKTTVHFVNNDVPLNFYFSDKIAGIIFDCKIKFYKYL